MSYAEYGLDEKKKSKDDDVKPSNWLCLWCGAKADKGFTLCFSNWVICYQCVWQAKKYIENERRWQDNVDCFKCNNKPVRGYRSHESFDTGIYICENCIEWGTDLASGKISTEEFKVNNEVMDNKQTRQLKKRACRKCGCTFDNKCKDENGNECTWVEQDLCSLCHTHQDDIKPKPELKERACRVCGCTEMDACRHPEQGNCWWVGDDLCSHCQNWPGESNRKADIIKQMDAGITYTGNFRGDPLPLAKKLFGKSDQNHNQNNMSTQKIMIDTAPFKGILNKIKEVEVTHTSVNGNILLRVGVDTLTVIATDLEVTIIAEIPIANGYASGYEYMLPYEYLSKLCGLIEDTAFTIELFTKDNKKQKRKITDAKIITVSGEDVLEDIPGAEIFPKIPEFPKENSIGIGDEFIKCLNLSLMTVGKEKYAPALQKVLIDVNPGTITIASCNTNVLYEKTFIHESEQTASLLVSKKIIKALDGFTETTISYSKTHVGFVSANMTLIGTLQDERFPDYRKNIPPSEPNLVLPLSQLRWVTEKMLVNVTEKSVPNITIYLKREIGIIVIECYNEEYNRRATERIALDYTGPCESISVDPTQMLRLLKQIKYVTVKLSISAPNRAILIETDADAQYRSMILPLTKQS